VPQDYEEAYAWSSLAAAQGNKAQTLRDEIASKLTPSALLAAQQLSKRYFADYVKKPSVGVP
jgi:TPR repeat protein